MVINNYFKWIIKAMIIKYWQAGWQPNYIKNPLFSFIMYNSKLIMVKFLVNLTNFHQLFLQILIRLRYIIFRVLFLNFSILKKEIFCLFPIFLLCQHAISLNRVWTHCVVQCHTQFYNVTKFRGIKLRSINKFLIDYIHYSIKYHQYFLFQGHTYPLETKESWLLTSPFQMKINRPILKRNFITIQSYRDVLRIVYH